MNKKGFTLIEILAVIVIIGVIGAIGVISISGNVDKSRRSNFIDLAKTYAEAVRTVKAADNLPNLPVDKEEIVIYSFEEIAKMEGIEIENGDRTAYGDLLYEYCYVAIVKENGIYSYYITMADESYHSINWVNYNELSEKDIKVGSEYVDEINPIKVPLQSLSLMYGGNNFVISNIKVKFNVTYVENEVAKNTSLTFNYGTALNCRGTISDYDDLVNSGTTTLNYNGKNYTIKSSEVISISTKILK